MKFDRPQHRIIHVSGRRSSECPFLFDMIKVALLCNTPSELNKLFDFPRDTIKAAALICMNRQLIDIM